MICEPFVCLDNKNICENTSSYILLFYDMYSDSDVAEVPLELW